MAGVEVSLAVEPEARADSLAIWNAVVPAVMRESAADRRDHEAWCSEWVDAVARLDGAPVGSVLGAIQPAQPLPLVRAQLAVLPAFRRLGAGTELLRLLSEWARKRRRKGLEAWVFDADPAGAAFAQRHGCEEALREELLALALADVDAPRVEPPVGIEIVTLAERPGLERGLYEVAAEAFPDVPGHADGPLEPFEHWVEAYLASSGDRPEAIWVALAAGEVIGYAKLHLSAQVRPDVALHDITAVKRAWRGRGVARALKQAEIAWAKAAGYERLVTGNELRNAPIRRLNERFGYAPMPGRALLRGPLLPAS